MTKWYKPLKAKQQDPNITLRRELKTETNLYKHPQWGLLSAIFFSFLLSSVNKVETDGEKATSRRWYATSIWVLRKEELNFDRLILDLEKIKNYLKNMQVENIWKVKNCHERIWKTINYKVLMDPCWQSMEQEIIAKNYTRNLGSHLDTNLTFYSLWDRSPFMLVRFLPHESHNEIREYEIHYHAHWYTYYQ